MQEEDQAFNANGFVQKRSLFSPALISFLMVVGEEGGGGGERDVRTILQPNCQVC